ncbi:uncharacterized protein LOC129583108 [Paramacrobiotus metropolitanus]|uniref:uncharacterized protein LOC129583108 n=1 Tax=Paramacrobiotus metropolitanus TaxID=2943436 RepID=UPI002445D70B|nr:uncharacterized protein LOC129583108 [Paramacrobiotus metropolitanus]
MGAELPQQAVSERRNTVLLGNICRCNCRYAAGTGSRRSDYVLHAGRLHVLQLAQGDNASWQTHEPEYTEHFHQVGWFCQDMNFLLRLLFAHDYVACALVLGELHYHKLGLYQPWINAMAALSQILMTIVLANAVAAVSDEGNHLTDVLDKALTKVDGISDAEENRILKQIRHLKEHSVGWKFGTMPVDNHFVWTAEIALVFLSGFIVK